MTLLRRNALAFAVAVLLTGVAAALLHAENAGTKPDVDTSRILSIGGDVTEILYELGLGPRIVAVDTTSKYPPETMTEKASVGYMRALSTEGVLSTNPTVIIASDGAGPPEVVAAIKASSVPYVSVSDDDSPEAIVSKVRFLSGATQTQTIGEDVARRIENAFNTLALERAKVPKPIRALVVLSVQNGRAVVGGRGSSADVILKLAGAENAASGVEGFKPVADEAGIGLKPDAIVFLQRAGSEAGTDELLKLNWVRATPAGSQARIVAMDAAYLLNFGPRAPLAARDLMQALYPDATHMSADAVR